jgi:class 3 adenylate cyclase
MTGSTDAALPATSQAIVRRYYLAMGVPYLVDLVTIVAYAAVYRAPVIIMPLVLLSATFLVIGVGAGAYFLIRPVSRFVAGKVSFADIQQSLTNLPRRSCVLVAVCFAPMVTLRLLSRRANIDFGVFLEDPTWIDLASSFFVNTGYNMVLTFFVVSAYVDRLCENLFQTRGVNLAVFHGRFRRKVAFALIFVAFAGIILLSADIASYAGARLIRESTMDVVASISGSIFIFFWINNALSRPIARLDSGMHEVAKGNYLVRLPVTSDDEMGHAAGRFNEMVSGLSEREYLRDTFGKYVSKSVATAILEAHDRTGRTTDVTRESTLMFTDIEGFTALSERLSPGELAKILNAYLGTVVPIIQRHGGVVNSFIGDGLFASFNLPLPCEGHAAAAIDAALEIQQVLAGTTTLRTRIGINTGTVVGLTIGTDNRLNYTLLGDAVNVASRLEQLNKKFGTGILASESAVRAAGRLESYQRLGAIGVRGHEVGIVVFNVGAPVPWPVP